MSLNLNVLSWSPVTKLKKQLDKVSTALMNRTSAKKRDEINSKKEFMAVNVNDDRNHILLNNSNDPARIIDGLKFIKQGSLSIALDGSKMRAETVQIIDNTDNWRSCYLDDNNWSLNWGQKHSIYIQEITRVNILSDIELKKIRTCLNCAEDNKEDDKVNWNSLKWLMFGIYFESHDHDSNCRTESSQRESCIYFLWDNYQVAYIWYRTLQMIIDQKFSWLNNRSSYPLLVSNRLRIGANPSADWITANHNIVQSVEEHLQLLTKPIQEMSLFISQFCILDSSCHLSMLSQVKEIGFKVQKIEEVLNILKNVNEKENEVQQVQDLYQLWQCLQADFLVCCLKCEQLKSELELDIDVIQAFSP